MKLFNRSMSLPLCLGIVICLSSVHALQAQPKPVVFTVAGETVPADEFEFQFLKNRTDKSSKPTSKELDEYVELYSVFKMKVAEARAAGMDTLQDYVNECQYQRSQIAPNYLFDRQTTDELVKEAYERQQFEIRASHILISAAPDEAPADTLAKYQRILSYRQHLLEHPNDFANYAKLYSEDPSAAFNGGDLGYFTVFNLVYPFENACYQTPVGQVSQIVRTQYGYHLIYIADKRKNPGDINFRQILVATSEEAGAEQKEAAKEKIFKIYEMAKSGTPIDELARSYSDDKATSSVGGESGFVKNSKYVGDIDRQTILNKAYALAADYDYSEPFQTRYGWHIVQRIEVKPLPPFEKQKRSLENLVSRDTRSLKSIESLITKVQKENNFTFNETNANGIRSQFDSALAKGLFKSNSIPEVFTYKYKPWIEKKGKKKQSKKFVTVSINKKDALFTLGNEVFTIEQYLKYLESYQRRTPLSPSDYGKVMMEDWIKEETVGFQDRHLEEKVPEFRFLYNEFREGILMFNYTRIKIWERPMKDTVGLEAFFKENRNKYLWNDRINVIVFTTQRKGIMDSTAMYLKKGLTADSIRKIFIKKNPLACDFRSGKYEASDSFLFPNPAVITQLFRDPKLKNAKNEILKLGKFGNNWVAVKFVEFLPAGPKELNETRGPVTSDFQDFLDRAWVRSMKDKYKVSVNNEVLESIRTRICQP